ncbi:hypothetical protein VTL71DRAFT_11157 [Oculimacula yallundae]|uniref:Uncharacterized protein n=1 Tax=Oculimacula yallundae TaxID=86028 RepID=A0ABR4CXD4_9HELO
MNTTVTSSTPLIIHQPLIGNFSPSLPFTPLSFSQHSSSPSILPRNISKGLLFDIYTSLLHLVAIESTTPLLPISDIQI